MRHQAIYPDSPMPPGMKHAGMSNQSVQNMLRLLVQLFATGAAAKTTMHAKDPLLASADGATHSMNCLESRAV